MDWSKVREKIETTLIEDRDIKPHPFGIPFLLNMRRARVILYDNAHLSTYPDNSSLSQIFETEFIDSKIEKWPTPVTYYVENERNVALIKIDHWNNKFDFNGFQCDQIVKVKFISSCVFIKYEFHIQTT